MNRWANPQKAGILIKTDGNYCYVDSGPEYEAALKGVVEPYIGPEPDDYIPGSGPPPVIPTLEFDQMLIGFVTEGWITKAEGEAWLKGTLPAAIVARIATLPVDLQFKATTRATLQTVIKRDDQLLVALGQLKGKTSAQIDTFFITYSVV